MLKRKIFGLDISDHSIEALLLKKFPFGKPKVSSYARMILKKDIVSGGVIKDPKKLAENITKLLASAKPKPIKTPYCILSLPESQVFTTIFKLPAGLRHDEIKKTIPYKAEEAIPFQSAEIYFDFKSIAKHGSTQEIFYVAVPMKLVDSYNEVLDKADLKPIAFDLESISLARALLKKFKKSPAKLLIDIGARTTNASIFDQNGIRQNLVIRAAGNRFTKAIVKDLGVAEKLAEDEKTKNGFDEKKQKPKALAAIKKEFDKIISEIKKSVDFYQAESQSQIDEIILAGGSALMPKIDKYVSDSFKIKASIGDPFLKIVADSAGKLKNYGVMFSNVSGLALRGVKRNPKAGDINLLPFPAKRLELVPKRSSTKAWIPFYIRLAVLAVLLLVLGAVFYFKNIGFDIYGKVFPTVKYESKINLDLDSEVIDQLRQRIIEIKGENTESQPTDLNTEKRVKIKELSGGTLNVRQGPGPSYNSVGQVKSGQNLKFIEEKDGWYKISFDENKEGWVVNTYADLVDIDLSTGQELTPEVKGVSIQLDRIKIEDTGIGFLNVRQGPGVEYEKVAQVTSGQDYDVLAEVSGWYKIEYTAGEYGWILSEYVLPLEENN